MTRGQGKRRSGIRLKISIALGIIAALVVTLTIRGNTRKREYIQAVSDKRQSELNEAGQQADSDIADEERLRIFYGMSEDWGSDADGFVYYQIPDEYIANGGYFPKKMQIYTYCLCKQHNVRYALIVAMIERESGYVFDRIGDDGNSRGYMQVYESAHTDRMEKLGCNDLLNPYQNVRVGIDYMEELIEKYGTIQDALAAYNYGEKGAREKLWSNGIYVYEYNEGIMNRMKEIEEELTE